MRGKYKNKHMALQQQNTTQGNLAGLQLGGSTEDPLMRRYLQLQVEDMERRQEERQTELNSRMADEQRRQAGRLREYQEDEQKRKNVLANQANCTHRQASLSLVRGQRLGFGKNYIFCQFCLKAWDDWNKVPADLHSPAEYFGGPVGF